MKDLLRRPRLSALADALLALCFVYGLNTYFFVDTAFSEYNDRPFHASSVLNIAALAAAVLLLRSVRSSPRRDRRFGFGFAALLACAMVLGRSLYLADRITMALLPPINLLRSVVTVLGFTAFIGAVIVRALPCLADEEGRRDPRPARPFALLWGLIFLLWLPALLAYWPGIYSYDGPAHTLQVVGEMPWSKFHPPLFTALWGLCLKLGERLGCDPLPLFLIPQMLALSACFAYFLRWLAGKGVCRALRLGAFAFLALNPVLAVFSVIMTKDVLFGALFLLMTLAACDLAADPDGFTHSARRMVRFSLLLTLCMLMRNNARYAILLALVPFVLALRRQAPRILAAFLAALVCFGLVDGVLYPALGVQEGEAAEALCVPMVQITNAAIHEDLPPELRERIDRFLPLERAMEVYNPRFADRVKGQFNGAYFAEHRGEFFKLWLHVLTHYPLSCVNAFLDLNLPFWYPDAATLDYHSGRAYVETFNWHVEPYSVERQSKLPALLPYYERAADFSAFLHRPVLNTLFSIATPIWFLLFTATVLLYRRRGILCLPLCFPFFLWLSYLAGPVSNFRYVFPIFILYPLFAALLIQSGALAAKQSTSGRVKGTDIFKRQVE